MAKNLMIQGTMSGVGKSILTAGILRVLRQDGLRVAPFKSQNMALNSFVTKDKREIGRAQALQAAAAGLEPTSDMNPILLKPMGDTTSQVIVNGLPIGNMKARDYFRMKKSLIPDILSAYERLARQSDVIVIEGAGSPVEINLRENDIVNMGLAEALDAPVLLVGDIDPGGVFAQLLGTYNLLSEREKERVKGLVINKFRGDVTLLEPGLDMFKPYCSVPFAGIVPFVGLDLDEEDSVSERLRINKKSSENADVRILVVRLPFISNYTDFTILEGIFGVSLSYIDEPDALDEADLIILPGTKNTISDMKWLYEKGIAGKIQELAKKDVPIIGICGGFQMLGRSIQDPDNTEAGGSEKGLGLIQVDTVFEATKNLRQIKTQTGTLTGIFKPLSDLEIEGYEIHMGVSYGEEEMPVRSEESVLGTYIHGIFDSPEFTRRLLKIIYEKKGLDREVPEIEGAFVHQEKELNKLADVLRQNLDFELIYKIINS
ncbi:cobyric acid synthase [Butyrivibrio sp. YAB3001]|uniref:cobyric acid synthase n=1 Tax=Butyrivibrio sp. YAB3001 TaxID=1520812 RepID=UPI0008F64ED1|nr:cobyric acid synthase [Butyrivibrio sp. YAB3001]SFC54837.1 adenosylcobyric acid synthase (glutamine-hydrolysing) [Butyrivibrio sp. YAB3001]